MTPRWRAVLGCGALAGYAAWNLAWIAVGRVPPSIFTAATGLPCPTTGGTRSVLALLAGDVGACLRYHPLALPLVALFGVTIVQSARQRVVTGGVARAWLVLLGVSWVIKLLSPHDTW